jgi:hypothetical protein
MLAAACGYLDAAPLRSTRSYAEVGPRVDRVHLWVYCVGTVQGWSTRGSAARTCRAGADTVFPSIADAYVP